MNESKNKIVLALDFDDKKAVYSVVDELKEYVGVFKIGKQLFTKYGPEIVNDVHKIGGNVFLDLKFHDIPNTVANAGLECLNLGVKMFNVHISGGRDMLKAVADKIKKESLIKGIKAPIILGVTLLTSINSKILKNDIKSSLTVKEQVIHYAKLAQKNGLNGVVASPQEISLIRKACGKDFIILTPGIRPLWAEKNDQKRIMTPKDAIKKGADYIVLGRAVTAQKNMKNAIKQIINEIDEIKE